MQQTFFTLALGFTVLILFTVSSYAATYAAFTGPTIYGLADLSVDYIDNGKTNEVAVSSNSSRFGVKGDMDLDDQLKAFFQFEWHVGAAETSDKNLDQRNQFVGLKGGFGSLKIGRINSPVKKLGRSVDLFYSRQLGENRSIVAASGFDARYNNGIYYTANTFNNLQWILAYYADPSDKDRIDDNDNDVISSTLTYRADNLYLGAGYEIISRTMDDTKGLRLVGSYKMSAYRLVAFYEQAKDVGGTSGADRNMAGIGWSYTRNKSVFKLTYYAADDLDTTSGSGGSLISAGMDYHYNKNATLYVTVGSVSNDDNASFSIVGKGHDDKIATIAGKNNSGLSLGMVFKF
ncbi:MAG: porin [Pseudomonadales bacterium]